MRILLLIYVIVFLLLNFLVDHPYIFFLAMSTFPVTLYLLLRRPKTKRRQQTSGHTVAENQSGPEEEQYNRRP